jgi:APA family basic amino acid/polyamine antiporter
VALSVNDVIGSGVYLLPAAAAAALGPASVWAVLAAGLCVFLLVLCFAEAGSLFDTPGGGFVYTRAAFGEFVGFEVGWMTWVARVTSMASLSAGFAQATSALWSAAGEGVTRALVITACLVGLTWINVRGIKHGVRTAVILTIGKVLPLLFLVVVGVVALDWGRIFPIPKPEGKGLGEAALLLLYAYAGFENTAAPAGEFKNPRRDIPFALFVMIASVTAIYTLIQLVAVGIVPDLAASATPLADAAAILTGPFGVWLLTIGASLSILGTNNNSVLAGSRYLYALADTGGLPRVLARIHPTYRTPWIALLVQGAIALPLALTGTFAGLAALSVIARMTTYVGTAAAVPVLRRKLPATPRTVRLPGGPLIPIAALVVCAVFLSSATWKNLVAGAIALIIGAGLYFRRGVARG